MAKAVEEQTRRRWLWAATSIVLLVATLAGAGSLAAWYRHRRYADFDRAPREVAVRKAEAETSGDDPARWATARESARRVEQVLDDAPDASTRSQVANLVADLKTNADAVAIESTLLEELAEIRDAITEAPFEQSESAYAAAFRAAGIDTDGPKPGRDSERHRPAPERRYPSQLLHPLIDGRALRRGHGDHEGPATRGDRTGGRLRRVAQFVRRHLTEPNRNTRLATLHEWPVRPAKTSSHRLLSRFWATLVRSGDATAAEAVLRPARRRYPRDLKPDFAEAHCNWRTSSGPRAAMPRRSPSSNAAMNWVSKPPAGAIRPPNGRNRPAVLRVLISISPRSYEATSSRQPSPNDSTSHTSPTRADQCNGGPALGRGLLRLSRNSRAIRRTGCVSRPGGCGDTGGSGKGKEDPPLDDPARLALLRQAARVACSRFGGRGECECSEPSAARDRACHDARRLENRWRSRHYPRRK